MARKVRVSGYARITRKPSGTVVVTKVKPYRRGKPTRREDALSATSGPGPTDSRPTVTPSDDG